MAHYHGLKAAKGRKEMWSWIASELFLVDLSEEGNYCRLMNLFSC